MSPRTTAIIVGALHAVGMVCAGMGKCIATGHVDIVCVATVAWGAVGFMVGLFLPQPGQEKVNEKLPTPPPVP